MEIALWQNLWVKKAQSGGRQASPLRMATGDDPSWRLETRRRRSPACRRTAWLPTMTTGDRSTEGSPAIQGVDDLMVTVLRPDSGPIDSAEEAKSVKPGKAVADSAESVHPFRSKLNSTDPN